MAFPRKHLQICSLLLAASFFFVAGSACGSVEEESAVSMTEQESVFSSPSLPTRKREELEQSTAPSSAAAAPLASLIAELKPAELEVYVAVPSAVYSAKGSQEALQEIPAGTTISVLEDKEELFWFEIPLQDGQNGFLYGETLFPLSEDGQPSSQSLTAQRVAERISSLREQFPQGKYWNHMGKDPDLEGEDPFSVTDIPCEHYIYGETYCNFYDGKTLDYFPEYGTLSQCMGFASLLSDQVFTTDAGLSLFYDIDQLRIGDHIRFYEYEHSMIVANKDESSITVAEVNENYEDCLISWNRVIFFEELEALSWDSTYATRYPMYQNESGGFSFWEDETGGFEMEYADSPETDYYKEDSFDAWEDWEE